MRAGEQEARKTFAAVFSGSSEHSCYGVIEQASNVGGVNATYAYNWCWQQAGQTTRVLGGTPTRLIVFKASDNGQADNYFSADWTYYFDPAVGIWAEGDAVSNRGIPPNNFIRTVVAPNT